MSWAKDSNNHLRQTIIQFLCRIMKLNKEFISLILSDLDLNEFLSVNVFTGDSSGLQQSIDFLQNFQRDSKFCLTLYSILLSYIDMLPEKLLPYSGKFYS